MYSGKHTKNPLTFTIILIGDYALFSHRFSIKIIGSGNQSLDPYLAWLSRSIYLFYN